MSLSRRDFLKYGGATATGAALGAGVDMLPVEAAAVSLRIKEAKAFAGVCPYCAVGCGQLIYSKDNKIIDIEGNPDTPHTLGRLCPKGAEQPAEAHQGALPRARLGQVGREADRVDV